MLKNRKHFAQCRVLFYCKERGEEVKDRISKLCAVKSIVTLSLTLVFCVLAIRGTLSGQDFLTVFSVVIAFYFGTQAERKKDTSGD